MQLARCILHRAYRDCLEEALKKQGIMTNRRVGTFPAILNPVNTNPGRQWGGF